MCFVVLPSSLANCRFHVCKRQNLANRYLCFVPFEDEHTMWPQHAKSFFESGSQVRTPRFLFNRPYFLPIQADWPTRSKCGGSNTTTGKEESANGSERKSAIRSGLITKRRPSHRVCASTRISANTVRVSCLLNQNMREPQHTSKIVCSAISLPLHANASGGTFSFTLFPKPLVKCHQLFVNRGIFAVKVSLSIFLRFVRQFTWPKQGVINP